MESGRTFTMLNTETNYDSTNDTGVSYSVMDYSNSYSWEITEGTLDMGQGTGSITLDWVVREQET